PAWVSDLLWVVIKVTIILAFVGLNFVFLVWLERKISAKMQARIGPSRVGPHGALQLVADGLKMFSKEDIRPALADARVWALAPVVMFAPAILVFYVLPLGPNTVIGRDLNVGVLYLAAVTSFTLVGVFMAGWGSNSKYSLLGAMRAGAALMAYEIPLVLSVLTVALLAGTLSLQGIVEAQVERGYYFIFPGIVAFIVYFISTMAELNRTPFDLVEAEQELVMGYMTEYSGMRWGMMMMAEYTNQFTAAAIAAILFLGGWDGPFLPGWLWLIIKAYAIVMVMMWVRWTLPRVRVDQILDLGWKFLLPVSLLNLVIVAIFLVW